MSKNLHIVEPTLFDQTGHGYSYVLSLLQANEDNWFTTTVWLDKRGKNLLEKNLCSAQPFFWRPLRQVQKIMLYARLLKTADVIFVSTADSWDLKLLSFWLKIIPTKCSVFTHFHQFKRSAKKLSVLKKLSQNSKINILTATEKLAQVFIDAGFAHAKFIPCPSFYPQRETITTQGFTKVLYAGAARSDKGFPVVINLLQDLRLNNNYLRFEIQASTPNSNRYDEKTLQALEQLKDIPETNLTIHRHTLDKEKYLTLFNDAICLLLYDSNGYNDKFSGIALDAFYAGCPVITIANTWMGDTAVKYQAGIALHDYSYTNILNAINTIIDNYAFYHNNAKNAAINLQQLHDPKNTLLALRK